MKKIDIEKWGLDIIERIENKQQIEDDFVELKCEWIDSKKAARQIAGHANAARGHDILWLIGIDEEKGLVGAKNEELANWFAQVKSEYDGNIYPDLTSLNISYKGKTVVALHFETERAPYVVKNPNHGKTGSVIEQFVPWRESNSTRAANRNDFIKLLVPLKSKPKFVFKKLNLSLRRQPNKPGEDLWMLTGYGFLELTKQETLIIPSDEIRAVIKISGSDEIILPIFHIKPLSASIQNGHREIIVENSGMLVFDFRRSIDEGNMLPGGPAKIKLCMRPAGWQESFIEFIDLKEKEETASHEVKVWELDNTLDYKTFQ